MNLISSCGLDCETCDARIATLADDNDLRQSTAEKWRILYNAPSITPEMINCTGCRVPDGIKVGHHSECGIRLCAVSKGYDTCGQCPELETCSTIAFVHHAVPSALENLKNLNKTIDN